MNEFIQLNRTFLDVDKLSTSEDDSYSLALVARYGPAKTWNDVLKNRCSVVLAKAGNGKTFELKAQAEQLLEAGQPAFFCALEILAENPLSQSIEIGADRFSAWLEGAEPGYFFLDSVDEARLGSPADFENAMIRFSEAIAPHKGRVTVVIASRPSAWQAQADRAMVARLLGLSPSSEKAAVPSKDETTEEAADANKEKVSPPGPQVAIVQLAPLNREQIRTFAVARSIEDPAAFIDAVERADADAFASRPADLPGLVEEWKKNKRVGHYSEVVENNIKLKLAERNPTHQHSSPIGEDRAYEGAEALAAAATLTKRTPILVPDKVVDPELRQQALDPSEVLTDWTPNEMQALLGRGLFDEGLYGTVRFHHRATREFLAARWFRRLLLKQKNRRAVERVFFAKPYGTEPEAVVPSLKPVVAWLSLWDQRIRDRLLRVDPKVLLEYGDASALDIVTREHLLRDFARRYQDRARTPLRLDLREVRRLSDKRLGAAIRDLLKLHASQVDLTHLLLRVVREGRVPDCGAEVLKLAKDVNADVYTRAYAVEAAGTTANASEKRVLATLVRRSAEELDPRILAGAIEGLWPDPLSDTDVVNMLEATPAPKAFSSSALDFEVLRLVDRLDDNERLLSLLRSVVALTKRAPLHDANYAPISKRYDWLIPFLWKIAQKLVAVLEHPESVPELLTALSLSEQADHLHRYTGDVHKDATQLINGNPVMRQALFWQDCAQARVRSGKPVTDWVFAWRSHGLLNFDEGDADRFLHDLRNRENGDDRLVALSVLATTYGRSGKSQLLDGIKEAIRGNGELESALASHLAPREPSQQLTESQRQLEEAERKREQQQAENRANRTRWIADLKLDPTKVGDLNIAPAGRVWSTTLWLLEEIRERSKSNASWTQSRWEHLVPEFGTAVAESFRDFCVQLWRAYSPQLRSEMGGDTNQVPNTVILGLSGLAMEARTTDWAAHLTPQEAQLATRYALWELNELPSWFWSLFEAHPAPVKELLIKEIKWEFDSPRPSGTAGYVLSRLRWTAPKLGHALRNDLIGMLQSRPAAHITPLAEALALVLRDASPLPPGFLRAAARHGESVSDNDHKALWLAVQLCLDADTAIDAIEKWIKIARGAPEKEHRLSLILTNIWGDKFDSLNSQHESYLKPSVLARLLKLAHGHVREQDDIRHDAVFSPGERDRAQEARAHLLQLLVGLPGRDTFEALIKLSKEKALAFAKDRMLILAEERAEGDVEPDAWRPEGVAAFAREAERDPKSEEDLFRIGLSRLDDVKLDLEQGDESEAILWRKVHDEVELRLVFAHRLKLLAQGKYATSSEDELADKTRNDIRLHHAGIDARIPIELKIAGRWTAKELRERLENQLIGQYLREAHRGVFLVVNRGAKNDRKRWRIDGKMRSFDELTDWLAREARQLMKKHKDVLGLEVIGIDLLVRDARARQDRAKKKAAPKASTKRHKLAQTKSRRRGQKTTK